jgi:hypothetical protein
MTKRAERESYLEVPETCPHVDHALEIAGEAIKHQTGALRDALNEALERALVAEDRIEELEELIRELRAEAAS